MSGRGQCSHMDNSKIYCYLHPEAHLIDDYDSGDIVCPLCGLVVVDRAIDIFIDSRHYSNDDRRFVRSYVGAPENYLLHAHSNLSTSIAPRTGDNVKETDFTTAMNLKYSQLKLLNASDRYLMLGFDEISCMGDRINLPQCVVDRAKYILKILDDRKALRGQTYYAKATACLYIACRQEHTPRSYKEICAISNSSKKEIGKCFKMILNVLTATKATTTAVRTVDSCDFIERFCGHLDLPKKVERIALKLSKEIAKLNQIDGRSPVSIAATAIYSACQITENCRTDEQICKICGISLATLDRLCRILRSHEMYANIVKRIKLKN